MMLQTITGLKYPSRTNGEARVKCADKMGLYDVCPMSILSETGFTTFLHIFTMFCLLGFFLPSSQGCYSLLLLNHCADARQWHHGPTPFRCRWRCGVCFAEVFHRPIMTMSRNSSLIPQLMIAC